VFPSFRLKGKRQTNTPVQQPESVLKYPDERKSRVVSAQATYNKPSRSGTKLENTLEKSGMVARLPSGLSERYQRY
jgi:hypothetical protein